MTQYSINNHNWERIFSFLQGCKRLHTSNESSVRRFVRSVWYITRTGSQWRFLPSKYGHWRAVHRKYQRWCSRGIWHQLMQCLKDPDLQEVMMDSTIVRCHACAAGPQESVGKSKGGFTTKIHVLSDALGLPLKFIITPGQRHDITQAEDLCKDISKSLVFGDKAYDSDKFINTLKDQGCSVVIPSKKNRKKLRDLDKHLYKERHLIECLIGKMKYFRRIFSRYDKTENCYLGFWYFVGTRMWLR